MARLAFIGYFRKNPFTYHRISDKILIESVLDHRDDEVKLIHWSYLKHNLMADAIDMRSSEHSVHKLKDSDMVIFLNMPKDKKVPLESILSSLKRRGIKTMNPVDAITAYSDRSYMILSYPEIPFPLTSYVDKDSYLENILHKYDDKVVLRPFYADSSAKALLVDNDAKEISRIIRGPYMLQEHVGARERKSLYFFDKKFRYAILSWNEGSYRGREGREYTPNREEMTKAQDALLKLGSPSLIERVDIADRFIIDIDVRAPDLQLQYSPTFEHIGAWYYEIIDQTLSHNP